MEKKSNSNFKLFTLSHLAVITVKGEDSVKFLQGQLTCDINSLAESQASIAAFCNPKGRVISTLLVVKTADAILLILPASLLDKVYKKLQIYILRSLVQLNEKNGLSLFGVDGQMAQGDASVLDLGPGCDDVVVTKLPYSQSRYLCIVDNTKSVAPSMQQNNCNPESTEEWRYLDISAGFPWFEESQSELYTPQMLNLDGLGGVSFNKGCYTGQEVIARTHYLGKAKRNLFVAESNGMPETPENGISVLDGDTQEKIGNILIAQTYLQNTRLLAILQVTDVTSHKLVLDDVNRTAIKILPI